MSETNYAKLFSTENLVTAKPSRQERVAIALQTEAYTKFANILAKHEKEKSRALSMHPALGAPFCQDFSLLEARCAEKLKFLAAKNTNPMTEKALREYYLGAWACDPEEPLASVQKEQFNSAVVTDVYCDISLTFKKEIPTITDDQGRERHPDTLLEKDSDGFGVKFTSIRDTLRDL